MSECPLGTFPDDSNVCQACDEQCSDEGCTGLVRTATALGPRLLSFIVVLALSDESGLRIVPQCAVGRRLRGGVSARNLHQRRQRLPSVRRRVRARLLRRRTSHARLTSSHHRSRCSHECITELRFRARLTALRVRTLSWATPVWRSARSERTLMLRSCARPATASATPTAASAQYVSIYFSILS